MSFMMHWQYNLTAHIMSSLMDGDEEERRES